MNKSRFIRNILIYFALLLGYVLLYVVDIEVMMNPDKEVTPKSNVNFVYQQF